MDNSINRRLLISPIPPPPGGDATWTEEYLKFCRAHDVSVRVVNTSITGKRAETNSSRKRCALDEFKRCLRIWSDIWHQTGDYKPDIAHMGISCSPYGSIRDFFSGLLLRIRRVPFVIHCHCTIEDQIGQSKTGKRFLNRLIGMCNGVVVLNTKSKEYINKLSGVHCRIIPNFLSDCETIKRKAIGDRLQKALFVGHIRKEKGIDEIIEAASHFPDISFFLVGQVTDDYNAANLSSVGENICFIGNVSRDEVFRLLDEADVFLLPSYSEGFSLALVEAMARGLPCIATDVGANRDMLGDEGGIVIPSHDVPSLVSAIETMGNRELRERMSDRNMRVAKEKYTVDAVMKEIENFYGEVMP